MEIILKEDVKNLGYKNDVVVVKPGFARNFLIPQGFALIATKSNKKMVEENIKQASHKAEKLKKDAEAIGEAISKVQIEVATKAGESGKIFGAITSLQISDAFKVKGIEVDRKKISINTPIKMIGEHKVTIILHKEVQPEITINVVTE